MRTPRVHPIDPRGLGALRRRLDEMWEQALASYRREAQHEQKPEDK